MDVFWSSAECAFPANAREQCRRARRLCHVPKMLDQFHANNSNADKHDTRCKACCAEYEKQKRAKKTRVHEPTVADKKCRCVRSTAQAASHFRLHPASFRRRLHPVLTAMPITFMKRVILQVRLLPISMCG